MIEGDKDRITMNDVRQAGYCPSGARRWFESYNFDFTDFIRNGMDIDTFLGTGDAMAQHVVSKKRERTDG